MNSGAPGTRRSPRTLAALAGFSPVGILVIVFLLLVLAALFVANSTDTPSLLPWIVYLLLVFVTWGVVAGVRREPGCWLGRRGVRRALVVAIAADCVGVVATSSPGAQVGSATVLLLLFLVLLNIALGRATERRATAPDVLVDERQEALRNRAHRLAYPVFAAIVGTLLIGVVVSTQSRTWAEHVLGSGGILVFLELLFVLPGMVLAVIEPAPPPPEPGAPERPRAVNMQARLAVALVGMVLLLPFLASVGVVVLPPHSSVVMDASPLAPDVSGTPGSSSPGGQQATSSHCGSFMATVSAGWGVSAEMPIFPYACWDGHRATAPSGTTYGPTCWAPGTLVAVTAEQCTPSSVTAPDGTLTLTWRATVSPELLPFLSRRVNVQVIIDRNGNVEIHS